MSKAFTSYFEFVPSTHAPPSVERVSPWGDTLKPMATTHCEGVTKAGDPCRARPVTGIRYCVAHTDDPAIRARAIEGSRRGGQRRGEQLRRVTASPIDVMDLDLETATGLRTYLARALQRLAAVVPVDLAVQENVGEEPAELGVLVRFHRSDEVGLHG